MCAAAQLGEVILYDLRGHGRSERPPSGYGLAEMRWNGDGPGLAESRASGRLGFHVLEVMEALLAAAATGRAHDVTSSVERPAPVPLSAR